MRFRLGLVTGFAAGYYLGAKAGRQRYDQINRQVARLKRSDAFEEVTEKAKSAVEEGFEKAKTVVDSRGSNGQGEDASPELILPGPPVQAAPAPAPEATTEPDQGSTEPPKGLGGYSSSR